MLHLLGLGRLLRLVQDGLQALVEPAPYPGVVRRRIVLQQSQQLHREPGRRHEVVRVVLHRIRQNSQVLEDMGLTNPSPSHLEVGVAGRDDPR